jgi:hypothetical protein
MCYTFAIQAKLFGMENPVKKEQINFRASVLTTQQLKELASMWGTSQTETITVAIDRIYRQEVESQTRKGQDGDRKQ